MTRTAPSSVAAGVFEDLTSALDELQAISDNLTQRAFRGAL